eukprot:5114135-Amphidinium_carterae.2
MGWSSRCERTQKSTFPTCYFCDDGQGNYEAQDLLHIQGSSSGACPSILCLGPTKQQYEVEKVALRRVCKHSPHYETQLSSSVVAGDMRQYRYYAHIQRMTRTSCDVSWLRPCAGRASEEVVTMCSVSNWHTWLHGTLGQGRKRPL